MMKFKINENRRPKHWRTFDEYLTRLLGGQRIKRLGFWLEGTLSEDDCEFAIELEDGTVIYTDHDYDEMGVRIVRPNGTVFTCKSDRIFGKTKMGLELYIDRYDTFNPETEKNDQ